MAKTDASEYSYCPLGILEFVELNQFGNPIYFPSEVYRFYLKFQFSICLLYKLAKLKDTRRIAPENFWLFFVKIDNIIWECLFIKIHSGVMSYSIREDRTISTPIYVLIQLLRCDSTAIY